MLLMNVYVLTLYSQGRYSKFFNLLITSFYELSRILVKLEF